MIRETLSPAQHYTFEKITRFRPTTRTTKTISDGTDSSRSSVLLDKSVVTARGNTDNIESFLRGGNHNMESYISFQSDIR